MMARQPRMTTTSSRKVKGSRQFKIELAPVPAARVKHSRWGAYYPARYETFRQECKHWLQKHLKGPILKGELEVISTFVCKRPKNPTNQYPRGDIDNFEKALYDAINASEMVWVDDTQISRVKADKRYTAGREKPCIHVEVRTVNYE